MRVTAGFPREIESLKGLLSIVAGSDEALKIDHHMSPTTIRKISQVEAWLTRAYLPRQIAPCSLFVLIPHHQVIRL